MAPEPVLFKFGSPRKESGRDRHPAIDLRVIFTDLPRTAAALAAARSMARGLGARITVLVAQVVPYPLPLSDPDVPVQFTEHLMESIGGDAETSIEILLCRDRLETIRCTLSPDSVVIVGARKWRDWYLTRMLRRGGWRVLVVPA